MNYRTCNHCQEELPERQFSMCKGYRLRTCNLCRSLSGQKLQDAKRNRAFNEIVSWPVPGSVA